MRNANIAVSDMHVGHRGAIMYPDPNLSHKPNKVQKWVFKSFVTFQDQLDAVLNQYKVDHIHLQVTGEAADIDAKQRHRSEHWEFDETLIVENASRLLDPLYKLVDLGVHFIRGTGAHVGPGGRMDNLVAKDCDVVIASDKRSSAYAWGVADYLLGGVHCMARHHGLKGFKWAGDKALVSFREEMKLTYYNTGQPLPDVVYGGHFHKSMQTQLPRTKATTPHVIQLPSWKTPYRDEFVERIDPMAPTPYVGGHLLIEDDGEVIFSEELLYSYPHRRIRKLKPLEPISK